MSDKITLLYVDDEPMNLMLFKRLFKDHFNILTAESGQAGIEMLSHEQGIKAVISDMRMPGMDGIEFVSTAKQRFPDTLFYILTGYDCTPEISGAINNQSISKYFSKPLNIKEILTTIEAAL